MRTQRHRMQQNTDKMNDMYPVEMSRFIKFFWETRLNAVTSKKQARQTKTAVAASAQQLPGQLTSVKKQTWV